MSRRAIYFRERAGETRNAVRYAGRNASVEAGAGESAAVACAPELAELTW